MSQEPMNNFTPRAQQVLALARKEADRFHHNYVGTEHILLGLIKLGQGVAVSVLQKMGLDLETVRAAVEKQVGTGQETKNQGSMPFTPRVKKVLALAGREAKTLNHSYVGTEHILLGLLREGEGVAARVLKSLEVDIERTRNEILRELDPQFSAGEGPVGSPGEEAAAGGNPASRAQPEDRKEVKTPALKAFGRDLTELARKGEMDPVVGRKNEIRRVVQILCRRTKNNPVLIGEAGVGKTAIVEGLAQEIAAGNVPEILMEKKVITLDLALMVAGTKYRGQFEERIKAVMDEIKRAKNIVLFIDELHTIVGAGAAEGAMDASNIFKPALSRGELQCVGATTLNEYRKYIEKDSALDRRFQSVKVEPPSVEDTIIILKGIRGKYEDHHKATFSDKALESAAKLSDRYITGRFLPDKAIDVMDEAGARARISALSRPPDIEALMKEIDEVCGQKEKAISEQHFEEAAKYRDKEKHLRAKHDQITEEWKKAREEQRVAIDEELMMQVVADWTGIPLSRMERKESEKLLGLENEIQKVVVGQEVAAGAIARALRRSRADLKDPRRPIGSFLFVGPTGVGKTETAKQVAAQMFGNQDALIQIDMSEYMEKFAVSRLIGSPPGYVGYEEGGQLTEAVRRRPYAVILFDEVEKAHPDVLQLLLQILEDGRLTDSLGRTVDFRNTIIIMTSNIGAHLLQRQTSMGFAAATTSFSDAEKMREKVLEEAKRVFKPEFLNRISDIVFFRPLDKADLVKIVELEVAKFARRLVERKISLEFTEEAKALLIDKGYDEKYGARPLRRAVEHYLEDPLAEAILRGEVKEGEPVVVSRDGEKLIFMQKAPPAAPAAPAAAS
ncbi:MAG TPA: ATP-dependent Clp protease ATP-binding subunit [Opitutaceae bacterium]|nr:ATP-dependent Clp protease ATP-binding subunit [Opitutaceae bacterium]